MSKEVKKQELETVKGNKKYVALALVVILAIIGIVMNNSPEEETVVVSSEPKVTANVTEEKPVEESTIARIDITTPLVEADKPQFEVYVDGSDKSLKQAKWMNKFYKQGYVIQKNNGQVNLIVKALNKAEISLKLRGPDKRDENKKFIPVWVDFTSLTVNGNEVLSQPVSVWHNKPFTYIFEANADKEYKIHAVWNNTDK